MRVLGRIRLSRFTDESTSVERQREIIEGWAALHGHEIVAWAVDLDVSRAVDPFETPKLAPWFEPDGMVQWDYIVCWKLDRLAVGSIYLNKVMSWCQENDKALVSVTENLDLTTWVGRLIANVIAGVAEGELELIRERTGGSQTKLRQLGRYHGGTVPYGYKRVKRSDGWYLVVDERAAPLVREIFARVVDAQSVRSIAADMVARGIKAPRGGRWTAQTITRMIRARWPLGQNEHEGQVVLAEDGLPLQRARPILVTENGEPDVSLWKMAQAVLDDRSRPKTRAQPTGILLDVAFCSECGAKLYYHVMVKPSRSQEYRYWRCSGRTKLHNGCPAPSIRAENLESMVATQLLEKIGPLEIQERVFVPANDVEDKLSQVNDVISTIRREKDLGLYEGDTDAYLTRLAALVERRDALKAEGPSTARWEMRGTGVTYQDRWAQTADDPKERRRMLLDSGIRVEARSDPSYVHVHVPLDVLEQSFPGFVADLP